LPGSEPFSGHLYPVWLKFKGGKGVATYLGVLLGLAPLIVLVFAAVWLGMAKLFKLFVTRGTCRRRSRFPIALYIYTGRPEDGIAVRGDVADHHSQAPREHPPPCFRAPRAGSGTRTDVCRRAKGRRGVPLSDRQRLNMAAG
jgi:hypothetical protein